jgi:uncharacterized protein (TIGR02996 family)
MNAQDFVPAIRDQPEDDMPRLVCADWFEEHGQPQRAEFIRTQIALARASPKDRRRRRLRKREGELLAAHEEEWAEALLGLANKVGFHRGFVERVTLTVADFIDGGEQLFALAPVREAVFVKTGAGLDRLADCPHLARLARIDFRDSAFAGEDLIPFMGSPHLGGLRAFVLRLRGVGDAVIQGLIEAKQPPSLETLDLYDAGVTQPAIEALAGWPKAATLRTLILGGSDLGEGAAVPLARSPHLAGLRVLHLGFAGLEDSDAQALAGAAHLAGLERLELHHNAITDEAADRLRDRFGDRVHL